ncbi:hypothetical protein ACA910_018624 [Epithemia clementina (nom. ined.)]
MVASRFLISFFSLLSPRVGVSFSASRSLQPKRSRIDLFELSMAKTDEDASNTDDYDLQRIKIGDREFWAQQKDLAAEMAGVMAAGSENSSRSKAAMREKFAKRRLALVGDTAYIGIFLFCLLWLVNENPFVPISYSLGALMGSAYAYGLGKYVETVGGSIDDMESSRGAGVGEARFAFLILLFILLGRFRDVGIQEVPAITGFFTYQLASLRQGLKEIND